MVFGGQFIDRFLPVEPNGPLRTDVWGGDNVLPRDAANGIEDETYSYWGGNIVKGDDGRYHMFPCRWREDNTIGTRSGHMTWGSSEVVHAVSAHPTGPYKVVDVIGGGHNPEVYTSGDGSYVIGCLGYKAYRSAALDGPWEKIETTFQWRQRPNNTSNRSYAVRDDGSSVVMTQQGFLYMSEHANEDLIELVDDTMYSKLPGRRGEDPTLWRDEVQFYCVYNNPTDRVAFFMRSPDGVRWTSMEGVAYLPGMMKHVDGTVEDWYKFERPKVLLDEHGRPTHMNFAVLDSPKWEDLANDKHGSKNVVLPLRVARRMQILNGERLTQGTPEISVKILAEDGFDPNADVDVASLRFGAPEAVNFGGGAAARTSYARGDDLVVVFGGAGSGFGPHNFAGKMIGKEASGELLFGFAKMKPSPESLVDEIRGHTVPDEVSVSGRARFAVSYRTAGERLLRVDLVDTTTGEVVPGRGQKVVNGEDTSVIHYATTQENVLNPDRRYRFDITLTATDDPAAALCDPAQKEVSVLPADAGSDGIAWKASPQAIPHDGRMILPIDFETRGKRDIQIDFLRANPRGQLRSVAGQAVEGRGTAQVEFAIQPSDGLAVGDECVFLVYLTQAGEGPAGRVSDIIRARCPIIDADAFAERYPQLVPSKN